MCLRPWSRLPTWSAKPHSFALPGHTIKSCRLPPVCCLRRVRNAGNAAENTELAPRTVSGNLLMRKSTVTKKL